MKKASGFTLLEMVVAVGIFGLIGLIAGQLLSQSIEVTEKVLLRGERLTEIQRAIQILEWDVRQLTHRGVRDEYGDRLPALMLSNDSIEFTRRGWVNATDQQRSNLQRVRYYVEEGNLIRRFWIRLDRATDTPSHDQILLRDAANLRFEVIDSNIQVQSHWPNPYPNAEGEQATAVAVAVSLAIDVDTELSLGWMIPEQVSFKDSGSGEREKPER